MTLQSSGQISMGDINTEMVRSGQFSHYTVINATGNGADTVNRYEKATAYPNTTTDYRHSEWYSYKHFPRNGLQAFYSANHPSSTNTTSRNQYIVDLSQNGNTVTSSCGTTHIDYNNNFGGILRDGYVGWAGRYGGCVGTTTSTINSGQSNVTYAFVMTTYWYGYTSPFAYWNGSTPYSLFWVPADTMQTVDNGVIYAALGNTTYGSGVGGPNGTSYSSEPNRFTLVNHYMVYFVTSNGTTANYYWAGTDGDAHTYTTARGSNTHSFGTTGNQCNRIFGRNTADTDSSPYTMSEFAAWNRILSANEMKRVATYWYSYMPDSVRHNRAIHGNAGSSPGYYTTGVNYDWSQIFTPKKLTDVTNGYNARFTCGGGYPGTWVMFVNDPLSWHRPYMAKWNAWSGNACSLTRVGHNVGGGWNSYGTITNYSSGNLRWATVPRNSAGDSTTALTLDWSGAWNASFAEIEFYSY